MALVDHLAGQNAQDGSAIGALVCAALGDRVLAQSSQSGLRSGTSPDEKCSGSGTSLGVGYDRRLPGVAPDPLGQEPPRFTCRTVLHSGGVGGIDRKKKETAKYPSSKK